MNRLRPIVLAVIGLQLTACTFQTFVRRPSTVRLDPGEREAALDRALATLQAQGWIVAVSDRAAGLITTQTMQVAPISCGLFSCPGRQTLQISIDRDGAVTVNLHEERFYKGFDASSAGWFVPRDQASVQRIEAAQRALLQGIAGRAKAPAPPTTSAAPASPTAPQKAAPL